MARRPQPATRPRRLARALAGPVLAGLLVAGCAGGSDGDSDGDVAGAAAVGPREAATSDAADAADAAADAAPTVASLATVHLVRAGTTAFFVEPVEVPVPAGAPAGDRPADRVARAVTALLAVGTPDDPDLATSVPAGTVLHAAGIEGDVVVLDLGGAVAGASGGSAAEVTLAQQLAHTVLAAAPGTSGLRVLVDGAPIASLLGHLDWSVPLSADPFALSPVTIEVPAHGARVPVGAVTVAGRATVFEGTVLVRLERGDGTVLEEGFVTATTGGPDRGTWTWTVTLPGPGVHRLVAGDTDPSGGEGRPPFEVVRTVVAD